MNNKNKKEPYNKISHDEYINRLKKDNPTIICLGEYRRAHEKIKFKCKICSYEWITSPSHLTGKKRTGCPKCKRVSHNKKTHEQFLQDVLSTQNKSLKITGKYTGANIKIKCQCLICNEEFSMLPSGIIKGSGHQKCSNKILGEKKRKSHHEFEEEIHKINPNIKLLSRYVVSGEKVLCECLKCGHVWSALPSNLTKAGCPNCGRDKSAKARKYSVESFSLKLETQNIPAELVGAYQGCEISTFFRCKKCNNIFIATPHHVLTSHTGCPLCNSSSGESKIEHILIKYNIPYIREKAFDDLCGVNGGNLLYDFYIPKYNKLIEYQGKQHAVPVAHFGGVEFFEIQKEHDKRKKEYAQKHNINLIEIWYYDFKNIEKILIKELKLDTVETAG